MFESFSSYRRIERSGAKSRCSWLSEFSTTFILSLTKGSNRRLLFLIKITPRSSAILI